MKKIHKYGNSIMICLLLLAGLSACKEKERFEIGYSDSVPPGMPGVRRIVPLYGGARIFFEIPNVPENRDLLSVDASYVNARGKTVHFSSSYFNDSLDVLGFSDTLAKFIQLYSVDRAGNISEVMELPVTPLEPAYTRVAKSIYVKPGFASFYVDWKNEIEQNINVYVDFSYTENGTTVERTLIYSSNLPEERWFIRDLEGMAPKTPLSIKVRVEDPYGNITDPIDQGQITLLEDELIPKDKWTLPRRAEWVAGAQMGNLSELDGRAAYAIDGIIDTPENPNYVDAGRQGNPSGGNVPWNILIDLGDEYEISRIITHQRYRYGYYTDYNVGIYNMYVLNMETETWEFVRQHKIPVPTGPTLEIMYLAKLGDMTYLYPDEPQFSKPTRWFRYEAIRGFNDNYSDTYLVSCVSEITLYGRKVK